MKTVVETEVKSGVKTENFEYLEFYEQVAIDFITSKDFDLPSN